MKKSTRILGIFLTTIVIILLISLFVAKAYLDSQSSKYPSITIRKHNFSNNIFNYFKEIDFKVSVDDLDNISKIEEDFFMQADQFITEKTSLKPTAKTELDLTQIKDKAYMEINSAKAIIIFSNKIKPKLSYKYYVFNNGANNNKENPVEISSNNIKVLHYDMDKNYLSYADKIIFLFIVLPENLIELYLNNNACSIQIACGTMKINNDFTIDSNASNIVANINNLKIDNMFKLKINATNLDFNIDILNSKELNFDFNASNSKIYTKELGITSSIRFKDNAGSYQFITENLKIVPDSFYYKANTSNSLLEFQNFNNFAINSELNASSFELKYNGETHRFTSDFSINSNISKSNGKDILKMDFDINVSKINLIFE